MKVLLIIYSIAYDSDLLHVKIGGWLPDLVVASIFLGIQSFYNWEKGNEKNQSDNEDDEFLKIIGYTEGA